MMTSLEESVLLIDGATGTLLENKGVDISLPLWSAHAVIEQRGRMGPFASMALRPRRW